MYVCMYVCIHKDTKTIPVYCPVSPFLYFDILYFRLQLHYTIVYIVDGHLSHVSFVKQIEWGAFLVHDAFLTNRAV